MMAQATKRPRIGEFFWQIFYTASLCLITRSICRFGRALDQAQSAKHLQVSRRSVVRHRGHQQLPMVSSQKNHSIHIFRRPKRPREYGEMRDQDYI